MAAQFGTVTLPPGQWVQFTPDAVSSARFQHQGSPSEMWVMGGITTTLPSTTAGAMRYAPGAGERATVSFADLFPHLGATGYLFAMCPGGGSVSFSNA